MVMLMCPGPTGKSEQGFVGTGNWQGPEGKAWCQDSEPQSGSCGILSYRIEGGCQKFTEPYTSALGDEPEGSNQWLLVTGLPGAVVLDKVPLLPLFLAHGPSQNTVVPSCSPDSLSPEAPLKTRHGVSVPW